MKKILMMVLLLSSFSNSDDAYMCTKYMKRATVNTELAIIQKDKKKCLMFINSVY
jgi:hypothetical protein